MPWIGAQRTDDQQFLFETSLDKSVEETKQELAEIHNTRRVLLATPFRSVKLSRKLTIPVACVPLRMRISRLKQEGEELAEYGPAKKPDEQGIDEDEGEKPANYNKDPTGRRTGEGLLSFIGTRFHVGCGLANTSTLGSTRAWVDAAQHPTLRRRRR